MPILNEDLAFDSIPAEIQATFYRGAAEKRLFPENTKFYKFTSYPLFNRHHQASPFWSSVDPLGPDDPGLAGTLDRATRLGVDPRLLARARSAVTMEWNAMSGLLVIRLQAPAFGFVGRCSHQRVRTDEGLQADDPDGRLDEKLRNAFFIGGAWQAYLPNLGPGIVSQA